MKSVRQYLELFIVNYLVRYPDRISGAFFAYVIPSPITSVKKCQKSFKLTITNARSHTHMQTRTHAHELTHAHTPTRVVIANDEKGLIYCVREQEPK